MKNASTHQAGRVYLFSGITDQSETDRAFELDRSEKKEQGQMFIVQQQSFEHN